MSAKPTTLRVHTMANGRRYVDAADIAHIAEVSELDLVNKYQPENFGSPRDFWWDGRRTWFAVLSLLQLADGLLRAGQNDAALRLREWAMAWIEAAMAEELRAARANRTDGTNGTDGTDGAGADFAGSGGAAGDSGLGCAGRITAAPAHAPMWYEKETGGMA